MKGAFFCLKTLNSLFLENALFPGTRAFQGETDRCAGPRTPGAFVRYSHPRENEVLVGNEFCESPLLSDSIILEVRAYGLG
jgi:hypothetical protein